MRIALLTSGRFTLCDLARELDALGHDVAFYSLVPDRITRRFGLPSRCNRWLGPLLAPFYAAHVLARGTAASQAADGALTIALDEVASRVIGPCDVFIGLSGFSLRTADAMRRKYGARIVIERLSRHILSQREILDAIPGKRTGPSVPFWAVRRELAEYALADRIGVPAQHVRRSFIDKGVPGEKVSVNPFGVDLAMFPPTDAPVGIAPTTIMAGSWSLRKGCDLLPTAWRALGEGKLKHVGPVYDADLPADPGFEHTEGVPQQQLVDHYARSHVFALASREEGLALVMPQALACGLPVVCSDRTGGEDLRAMIPDPHAVTVVPCEDVGALTDALREAHARAKHVRGRRDLLGSARSEMSWSAYGRRYNTMLNDL